MKIDNRISSNDKFITVHFYPLQKKIENFSFSILHKKDIKFTYSDYLVGFWNIKNLNNE